MRYLAPLYQYNILPKNITILHYSFVSPISMICTHSMIGTYFMICTTGHIDQVKTLRGVGREL